MNNRKGLFTLSEKKLNTTEKNKLCKFGYFSASLLGEIAFVFAFAQCERGLVELLPNGVFTLSESKTKTDSETD